MTGIDEFFQFGKPNFRLFTELCKKSFKIISLPYEIYTKSHTDNLPVSEWETEIYFPVEKL